MGKTAVLIRHGQTEWSRDRRHTSVTDLPLLPEGEAGAVALGPVLAQWDFSLVLSSPRQRALTTARLALPGVQVEIDEDLSEWDYGKYEGITTVDIHKAEPTWNLWTDGGPEGESPSEISTRVDRVIQRILAEPGLVAVFAHGHVLPVLAARWAGLSAADGRIFPLDTTTISILDHEHDRPVVRRWNAPAVS